MNHATCSVDGCDRPRAVRSWCSAHYKRWNSSGSVRPDKPLRERTRVPIVPLVDRFWRNVDKTSDPNGCWLWTAALDHLGYGRIQVDGNRLAHRVGFTLLVGPIPDGLVLDHLCRVRHCVNPDHLEAVTQDENVRRGRGGEFQAAKTHCPHGHEYDIANTYIAPNGKRQCRACRSRYR